MATIIQGAVTIDHDTGNIDTPGTVKGRDLTADGAKLDGIDAGAEENTVDSVNTQTGAVVLGAADVGADPAGTGAGAVSTHESTYDHAAYDAHGSNTSNPHGVTAVQAGADPIGTAASIVAAHEAAYDHDAYDTHVASTLNPHSVTAVQAGADPAGTASSAVSSHESTYNHGRIPSADEDAAISGAASPSGANVFATMNDIASAGGSEAEVKEIATATYTLLDDDSMKWLRFTNVAGCVITIPDTWAGESEVICEGVDDALDFTGTAVSAATLEAYGSHSSSEGAGAVCGLKCTSNSGGSSAVVTLFGRTAL